MHRQKTLKVVTRAVKITLRLVTHGQKMLHLLQVVTHSQKDLTSSYTPSKDLTNS